MMGSLLLGKRRGDLYKWEEYKSSGACWTLALEQSTAGFKQGGEFSRHELGKASVPGQLPGLVLLPAGGHLLAVS